MKLLNHIILLSRPFNIFIAVSSAIIMSVIIPNADYSNLYLICLILIFYMSAANILNDIVDIESDRINKPHRILVKNDINLRILIVMIIILFSLGSILTINLPILARQIALFCALPCILLYELFLKRIPLIGNIVISLMVGLVFVFTSSGLDADISHSLRIMCLAFFLNLIREIIKDIQDFEGDASRDYKTLPIYFGKHPTIILIRFIFITFFIISISPIYTQNYKIEYIPLLVFLIHIPLLYIIKRLKSDISSKECAKLSGYLKITIINGILIILISAK